MASPGYVGLDRLEGHHYDTLSLALRNVLNTDISLMTYAQIIDGLPTADVVWDRYSATYEPSHPIINHKTLCKGALEKVHDPATTAGYDIESTIKWERPPDDLCRFPPKPTMFIATQFTAHDRYPNGVDDMVGYWAENRILGGVALFDHSQAWTRDDEPNVYFQCTRGRVTFRVCQLLDTQQSALLSFLLADSEDAIAKCPLPILPTAENRVRIDPGDAIPVKKVYRDTWERKHPPRRRRAPRLERPETSLDYPEARLIPKKYRVLMLNLPGNDGLHIRNSKVLHPEILEVGPEDDFVISPNMYDDSQLQNPVCVDAKLCRLCRFPINREKEKIVALTPDDQVSSPFKLHREKCYVPSCVDKSLNISFRHCVYQYCTHNKGLAIVFHARCVEMAAPFGTPLREYHLVTEHSYRHALLNHKRRRCRVRYLIEGALCTTYGKLSPELWHIVSDDDELIRLYAIAELSIQHRKTEWSADVSLPVLMTVIRMDGLDYVGSLTNSPGIASRRTAKLITPSDCRSLYISSDHLGIRQVILVPSQASSDTAYPAYWQTVSASNQTLTFHGDGLKLRKLLTPSIYSRVLWPYPVTPPEIDSMTFYYAGWGEGDLEARLRTLTFNEPGTAGYSVCWANDEMVSLHVHRNAEYPDIDASALDRYSEYEDRSHLKWTYYPIQGDEFVQEVWLRGCEIYDTTRPLPSQGEGGFGYQMSTPWGLQKYKRPSDMALAVGPPPLLITEELLS
ncbi:hypothetical protein F52700_11372 [Fusarium sp. NRRL 52700]|nr:hypothetical protein F52700_11372 [Fusarium sp. NRRL 52700]